MVCMERKIMDCPARCEAFLFKICEYPALETVGFLEIGMLKQVRPVRVPLADMLHREADRQSACIREVIPVIHNLMDMQSIIVNIRSDPPRTAVFQGSTYRMR